jgi:AcrR family transcriptional regulator
MGEANYPARFNNFFTRLARWTLDIHPNWSDIFASNDGIWVNSTVITRAVGPAGVSKTLLRPAPRPRRKRDRSATQEALLQAALRLFAAKGYEPTTTREIAASAGCAEGLIQRYFTGKAGLLAALVEYRITKEVVDLSHKVRPAPSPRQEFLQLVNWEVERMWGNRDFLRVFIPRAIVDPEVAAMMNHAVISVPAKAVVKRLKQYRVCGKLPQEELEALAQSVGVIGLVFGFLRPVVLGNDRVRAKKMAAVLAKALIRGFDFAA